GTVNVFIDHCRFELCGYGVVGDRAAISIHDSVADGIPSYAFFARGGMGPATMVINSAVVAHSSNAVTVWNGSLTAHNVALTGGNYGFQTSNGKLSLQNCVA